MPTPSFASLIVNRNTIRIAYSVLNSWNTQYDHNQSLTRVSSQLPVFQEAILAAIIGSNRQGGAAETAVMAESGIYGIAGVSLVL